MNTGEGHTDDIVRERTAATTDIGLRKCSLRSLARSISASIVPASKQ